MVHKITLKNVKKEIINVDIDDENYTVSKLKEYLVNQKDGEYRIIYKGSILVDSTDISKFDSSVEFIYMYSPKRVVPVVPLPAVPPVAPVPSGSNYDFELIVKQLIYISASVTLSNRENLEMFLMLCPQIQNIMETDGPNSFTLEFMNSLADEIEKQIRPIVQVPITPAPRHPVNNQPGGGEYPQIAGYMNSLPPEKQTELKEIIQMGFDQFEVAQLYEATGRNKEATINLLNSQ